MSGIDIYCLQELKDPEDIEIFQRRVTLFIDSGHYYGWQFTKGSHIFVILGVDSIQDAQGSAEDWFRHFGGTDFYDDVNEVSTTIRLGRKTWLTTYITLH